MAAEGVLQRSLPSSIWLGAPPTEAVSPGRAVNQLIRGALGLAVFGFALRTTVEKAAPNLTHVIWALALPAAVLLSWLVCLPALYILWAAKQPQVSAAHCANAAIDSTATIGVALASTAPILWFFAVTAPQSRLLAPLGIAFTGLAFVAGAAFFGTSLRRSGARLSVVTQVLFLVLVLITFAQFAAVAGLHWF